MLPPPHLRKPSRTIVTWLLVVLTVLILLFALIAVTAGERRTSSTVEHVITTVLYPFQNAAGWVTSKVRGTVAGIRELFYLREENARLRSAVERLEQLQADNERLARENARLRAELGLRERTPYRLVAAQVISRDPSLWFQSVVINRGARDGVQEQMVVIDHRGVVGHVERVTAFTSTVRLVTAGNFEITARNVRSDAFGVVTGQADQILIRFPYGGSEKVEPVQPGDRIVTSGYNPLIPGGLYIGEIAAVVSGEHDLIPFGVLRPGADLKHLDVVQVVLPEQQPAEEGAP